MRCAQRTLQCASDFGLGGHKVIALPGQRLVMGHVNLLNRGASPLYFNKAGYQLFGAGGPIGGDLRCPSMQIPAGGNLQVDRPFCCLIALGCLGSCGVI